MNKQEQEDEPIIERKTEEHDFADVESVEEAFEKLSEIVKTMARQNGHKVDLETISWDAEKTQEKRDVAEGVRTVGYEAGPSDWAVRMLGGESITVYNLEDDEAVEHKLVNFWDNDAFHAECAYSFEIHVYDPSANGGR